MTPEPPEPDATGPDPDPEARGVRLVRVLLVLTVVSGLIDAVSFLGLRHIFTANMTGNVLVIGFAAAGVPGFSVPHSVTSLGCFLAGAVAGGRVIHAVGSHRLWARTTLTVESALLAAAAVVAFAAPDEASGTVYSVIALTAFALGMRTATVRKLGVADLPTTVLTMTLTGLASESHAGGGHGTRFRRRAAAVAALFAGALLGAWLVIHHGLGPPLLLAALLSGALALTASGRP
ncbi:YoaK family protein [Streptomyces sp. NPDC017936]|uniref:YoaK family protein n=1 Tax=Streptomyces sp. NPDC017936 TaxID=3365016 RepID=UPI0037B2A3C7